MQLKMLPKKQSIKQLNQQKTDVNKIAQEIVKPKFVANANSVNFEEIVIPSEKREKILNE